MKGSDFKKVREELGLSQDQLACLLGLSGKQAVSNIETGLRNPSPLVATILLVLLELPEKRSKELQSLLLSVGSKVAVMKRRRK